MLDLSVPLAQIPGIGPHFVSKLKKLNIETVRDLLWHFPFRYEDFSQIYQIADLEPGQQATVQGVVRDIDVRRTWQRRMMIVEAIIEDDSGSIRAVWFNQPYIKNVLRPGRLANFSGKVALSENDIYLSHPTYELIGKNEKEETRHTGRLVPIYPETRGLTSRGLRFLIQPILKNLESLTEWMPKETLKLNRLPEINRALQDIHYPETVEDATVARKRFAFEDLFLLQLFNLHQKLKLAREKAPVIKTDLVRMKSILAELPFNLTLSQKKSLWEIIQDLEKPKPMNRLLQGDVGSGKTVVAALAALVAAQNNYQTAFMAPTEVLANQHFETLKKLFGRIRSVNQPVLGLLTSAVAKIIYENDVEADIKKGEFSRLIKNGEVKIVIGTHALIQKTVMFKKLGLVIIDEQHRFGVEQRAALSGQRDEKTNFAPHFFSMSATPIPRTLMLTIFGDLDISTITELPAGRKNIITKVVAPANRSKAYQFIREQIKKGRQAFVICPRIENDPKNLNTPELSREKNKSFGAFGWNSGHSDRFLELKSVKEEYEKLSKKIFPDFRVAMLHGQMKSKEKGKIMSSFAEVASATKAGKATEDKKTDILVSTSVIEVGVDVPNATIMMIEGSDRFGLAQLYQFRGRVGRGKHQSFCFLFTDSSAKTTHQRLKAILEAKNGFELAEKDLQIRGPGEFLGQKQTGLPDIAMSGLQNIELIKMSRASAMQTIQSDPTLKKYPLLKSKLAEFHKKIHLE
jgi:ATP-dependent DNA helicase RecG